MTTNNQNLIEEIEKFATELGEKVKYFSGQGQYEIDSIENKAYKDGVDTAIGMMYIDLTGTPKTDGMLKKFANSIQQQTREEAHKTENGYCCACDYDIAVMEEKIKQTREEVIKVIENEMSYCGVLESNEKRRGYDIAIKEVLDLLSTLNNK
jgi:hypothetical protein